MTAADVIERARERLDEDLGASSQRYPTATLSGYVLDGVRAYVSRVGNQWATYTYTQEANVLMYDLPCDFIQAERVLWYSGGTYWPLEATGHRNLDIQWDRWQTQQDTRSRAYFIYGLDRIALWPLVETAGEEYVLHYKQDVYDGITRVPKEDHECMVDYVLARCLLSEGKSADGVGFYKAFRATCVKAKRRRLSFDSLRTRGETGFANG